MAEMRGSAEAIAQALTVHVPQKYMALVKRIYFDAATQLHEQVVLNCADHVDTGYMRAGFSAVAGNGAPESFAPRDKALVKTRGWRDVAPADPSSAIATAVGTLQPLTMGFLAIYAQYVEAEFGMVARARLRWQAICRLARSNAVVE